MLEKSAGHRQPDRIPAMKNMPIYEALAQAFAAEGVAAHVTLIGDGNTRRTVGRGHGKM